MDAVKSTQGHLCLYCADGTASTLHGLCQGYDPHPASRNKAGDLPECTCYCQDAKREAARLRNQDRVSTRTRRTA